MVMVGEKSEIIDFSGQFSATGEQRGHVVVHGGHGYQNFLLPPCTGVAPPPIFGDKEGELFSRFL